MVYKAKERLKYLLDNGYVHGLRYLGDRCGFYGKIFWLVIMTISAIAMSSIFVSNYNAFQEDTVTVNADSSYLHWNNTFPAVSLCMTMPAGTIGIRPILEQFWSETAPPKMQAKIIKFLHQMLTYIHQSSETPLGNYNDFCYTQNSTCGLNITNLRERVLPRHCKDVIGDVFFKGIKYKCEQLFKFYKTEVGNCFTANSLSHANLNWNNLPLRYMTRDRTLTVNYIPNIFSTIYVYVHSPEDFPSSYGMTKLKLDSTSKENTFYFHAIETINMPGIAELERDKRHCRFPYEQIDAIQMPYSVTTCSWDIRIRTELEICNCTSHTSPDMFEPFYCLYKGVRCISDIMTDIQALSTAQCMTSCIGIDVLHVGTTVQESNTPSDTGVFHLRILNKNNLRYVRKVGKTNLDLVVTIGGIFGLFFGASLATFAQIAYIFCLRKF